MNYVGPLNLIIPVGVLKNGSDVFNILDPDSGGAGTFSVALSADGAEPVTHYAARTYLEESALLALRDMSATEFKAHVDRLAFERGRAPTGSVTAFKKALLIDDGSFWEFVTVNGLLPVSVDDSATTAAPSPQSGGDT